MLLCDWSINFSANESRSDETLLSKEKQTHNGSGDDGDSNPASARLSSRQNNVESLYTDVEVINEGSMALGTTAIEIETKPINYLRIYNALAMF